MNDEVEALCGQFVVEVGVRQAWPFLTFADNAPATTRETRLYIGTTFRVDTSPLLFIDGDPDLAVVQLLKLSNRTVTGVTVGADGTLCLVFDDGQSALTVDAERRAFSGDIWWLAHL